MQEVKCHGCMVNPGARIADVAHGTWPFLWMTMGALVCYNSVQYLTDIPSVLNFSMPSG